MVMKSQVQIHRSRTRRGLGGIERALFQTQADGTEIAAYSRGQGDAAEPPRNTALSYVLQYTCARRIAGRKSDFRWDLIGGVGCY